MNKLAIVLTLISLPFTGSCDTLDYWHVYYNDSVIARFNTISEDLKIQIGRSKIDAMDTISIRYGNDTPCFDCRYLLLVKDERKRKLRIAETTEFFGKLSIGLTDLLVAGEINENKRFDFYFSEVQKSGSEMSFRLLLQMIVVENT